MCKWLEGKTNAEVYYYAFHSIMMRPFHEKQHTLLGNSQREQFVPILNQILAPYQETQGYGILDVGAGSGEIVDLSFQFMRNAVISIEDPNPMFLTNYLSRVKNFPQLKVGGVYSGTIQDMLYSRKGINWVQKLPEQDIISAIHMIYHLTDFNIEGLIVPEIDIIEMISLLYEKLSIGGTIFLVYAEQLDSIMGWVSKEYFHQKSLHRAKNLNKVWRARQRLLREGRIQKVLQNRYPDVECVFNSTLTMSRVYAYNESELALICLSAEMGTVDSEPFDVDKYSFCVNLIRDRKKEFGIVEEFEKGPRCGMLSASQPQVVCVIKKMKC